MGIGVPKTTKYEFTFKATYGDGQPVAMPGHYKVLQYVNEEEQPWRVIAGSDFQSNKMRLKELRHYFELRRDTSGGAEGSLSSTPALQQSIMNEELLADRQEMKTPASLFKLFCPPPQRKITIQIQTDRFGNDTSWEFRLKDGPALAKNERTYRFKQVEVDERSVCVEDSSLYELEVHDAYGDGMCCRYSNGHYKIIDHNQETVLHGGFFFANKTTHLLNTTKPYMSERDEDWLFEHNKRRKYWHHYYNTSYVPLLWSESLKAEAKVWADSLLDACGDGIYHDPKRISGENAAANTGSGGWGTKREPGKILSRFVEYEVDDPWPANGHLTQTVSMK